MRVVILGGTSLTGPHVVRRLHALGHDVTVFHRGTHEAGLPAEVRHVHGDLAQLPRDLCYPAPDVVVHMWAMTEADAQSFLTTFRGTAGRATVISSGDVYRAYGRLQGLEAGPPGAAPTMAERLADFARVAGWGGRIRKVPASELSEAERMLHDFRHHLAYDTTRVRAELGYREVISYEEGLARVVALERSS